MLELDPNSQDAIYVKNTLEASRKLDRLPIGFFILPSTLLFLSCPVRTNCEPDFLVRFVKFL